MAACTSVEVTKTARHETRQVMEGGAVVIPKDMRDALGIGDGDHVEFERREGEVMLRRGSAPPARESARSGETGIAPNKVQAALKGMDYPAKKEDLVAQAKKNHADAPVTKIIERFPEQEYGATAGAATERTATENGFGRYLLFCNKYTGAALRCDSGAAAVYTLSPRTRTTNLLRYARTERTCEHLHRPL